MKHLVVLFGLMVSGAAFAQAPQDFAWRAELSATPGLNVVTLTEPVYRAVQTPDLRDLRLFNARGEALPFAPVAAPPPVAGRAHDLKMVPLPAQPQVRDKLLSDFALRVEKDGARAVVELTPVAPASAASTAETSETIGGLLLDLRPHRGANGELVLHFADDAADFTDRIEVLGSDDLYAWRVIASAPLVRNRQLGDTIERKAVAVTNLPSFARIGWSGKTAPRVDGARFVEAPAAAALPWTQLAVVPGDNDRTWFVEVPPALPVSRVRLRAPRDNMSVRVRLYRYDERDPQPRARLSLHARRAPERWIAEGGLRGVYRLDRAGVWIESEPFALSTHTPTLRIDAADEAGFAGALPIVEVEWQPQRIVFAANTPAPYVIAAGHDGKDLKATPSLDLRGVLPADDPSALRLPVAQIGAATTVVDSGARAERIAREASWSRHVLWAALAAAVCALGFMAWRLAGQLKATAGAPPSENEKRG